MLTSIFLSNQGSQQPLGVGSSQTYFFIKKTHNNTGFMNRFCFLLLLVFLLPGALALHPYTTDSNLPIYNPSGVQPTTPQTYEISQSKQLVSTINSVSPAYQNIQLTSDGNIIITSNKKNSQINFSLRPLSLSDLNGSDLNTNYDSRYLQLNGVNQSFWTPTNTLVPSLNADLLDGLDSTDFASATGYLKLNQGSPQIVFGGKPEFSNGLRAGDSNQFLIDVNGNVTLGIEKVNNAGFSAGVGWTDNGGGSFTHTTGTATLSQNVNLTIGKTYRIAYSQSSGSSLGSITATIGGSSRSISTGYTNGKVTDTFIASNTNDLVFTPTNDFVGDISEVSVKEVISEIASGYGRFDGGLLSVGGYNYVTGIAPEEQFVLPVNQTYFAWIPSLASLVGGYGNSISSLYAESPKQSLIIGEEHIVAGGGYNTALGAGIVELGSQLIGVGYALLVGSISAVLGSGTSVGSNNFVTSGGSVFSDNGNAFSGGVVGKSGWAGTVIDNKTVTITGYGNIKTDLGDDYTATIYFYDYGVNSWWYADGIASVYDSNSDTVTITLGNQLPVSTGSCNVVSTKYGQKSTTFGSNNMLAENSFSSGFSNNLRGYSNAQFGEYNWGGGNYSLTNGYSNLIGYKSYTYSFDYASQTMTIAGDVTSEIAAGDVLYDYDIDQGGYTFVVDTISYLAPNTSIVVITAIGTDVTAQRLYNQNELQGGIPISRGGMLISGEDNSVWAIQGTGIGLGLVVQGRGQTAFGQYNLPQGDPAQDVTPTDLAFIIGNGTNNANRSNAFSINWNGDTNIQGNLFADGNFLVKQDANIGRDENIHRNLFVDQNLFVKSDLNVTGVYHGLVDWINVPISVTLTGATACSNLSGKITNWNYSCVTCVDSLVGTGISCSTIASVIENCACRVS